MEFADCERHCFLQYILKKSVKLTENDKINALDDTVIET